MKTETPPVNDMFNALPDTARAFFEVTPGFHEADKLSVEAELSRLPFVAPANIRRMRGSKTSAIVDMPVSRIISSLRPSDNWASKGEFKHTQSGNDIPSINYALNIASTNGYQGNGSHPIIEVFEDSDGESWGIVVDGHHRVMAAKLLGVDLLEVDLRQAVHEDETDRYDGSIIAEVIQPIEQ